jgi:TolB-like protein
MNFASPVIRIGLALVLAVVMSSCACQMACIKGCTKNDCLMWASYCSAERLADQAKCDCPDNCVIVATLVDVNNYNQTTMFGRQTAEFVTTQLAKEGLRVIQPTTRNQSIAINDAGQFVLSRDLRKLATDQNARSVVVGSYGKTGNHVYVSLRLVRTEDNAIMAAHDFRLALCDEVKGMLCNDAGGWRFAH